MSKENTIIFGDIVSGDTDLFGDPIEETTEDTKVEKESSEKKEETVIKDEEEEEVTSEEKVTATPTEESSEVEEDDNEDLFGDALTEEERVEKAEKESDSKTGKIDYLKRVKDLVNDGVFYNFEELDELESLTKEEYEEIRKQQLDAIKDDLKDEVLSDLSTDEKEFLEYKKSGGNLEAYTKSFLNKQRVQNFDISTDNGKKAVVFEYYTKVNGYTPERAHKMIGMLEKGMELEDEAEMLYERLNKYAEQEHQEVLRRQQEYIESIQQAERDYRESVKNNLKESGVDTKNTNKILKTLTERDERGFTPIDKAFLSLRNDPEKSKFLYDILMDFDTFKKSIEKDKQSETALNTIKKIKFKEKRQTSDVAENKNNNIIQL